LGGGGRIIPVNCLTYALRKLAAEGGYLVIRRSRYGWFPHVIWSRDLVTFEDFRPVRPKRRKVPPLWFRGRVRRWTAPER
jgi:hypothetical protein